MTAPDQSDPKSPPAPLEPQPFELTMQIRDDGTAVRVALLPPPLDWFKTCRPGEVAMMPVLAVVEHNVRQRKPVTVPGNGAAKKGARR